MYASSAFTDAYERSRRDRLLAGFRRVRYLPTDFPSLEEVARSAGPVCTEAIRLSHTKRLFTEYLFAE